MITFSYNMVNGVMQWGGGGGVIIIDFLWEE